VIFHAVPSIATMYLWQSQALINLIFIGHYGNEAMIAGVGTGNMINNIVCLSIINGMNGAVETLVSQSFGAGNLQLCG
jgi:Na+-driven multidrug efflux pump